MWKIWCKGGFYQNVACSPIVSLANRRETGLRLSVADASSAFMACYVMARAKKRNGLIHGLPKVRTTDLETVLPSHLRRSLAISRNQFTGYDVCSLEHSCGVKCSRGFQLTPSVCCILFSLMSLAMASTSVP